MHIAYLHGFASSPQAKKALVLRRALEARGERLFVPDLNAPSFAALSVRAMLERVGALDAEHGDAEGWGLVGSSLGGWVAARWTELHPERVPRMILLCPAFDIGARWPRIMPPGAMETWERDGAVAMADAEGRPAMLHYRFYEEAREEPAFPRVPCPTIVIHGTQDDRVPIESSRAYAAEHADRVRLIEVDDAHDLLASQDLIVDTVLASFLREPGERG